MYESNLKCKLYLEKCRNQRISSMPWTAQFDSVLAVDERPTLFPSQNKSLLLYIKMLPPLNQEVLRVVKEQLITSTVMARTVHVKSTDHGTKYSFAYLCHEAMSKITANYVRVRKWICFLAAYY